MVDSKALNTLTKAFYYIPKAALAAIIMMSVVHMIDIPTLKKIAKTKASDLIVWGTSFFLCLLWSLEMGILVAIGVSLVLREIATSMQPLHRLKKTSTIRRSNSSMSTNHASVFLERNHAGAGAGTDAAGSWEIDDRYEIVGLPSRWSKAFTADTVADGYIVLKLNGSLTFSMANALKDRLANILLHVRSGGQTTAIILDFSTVPSIDFTGALAVKSILEEAKPAKRKVPLGANGGTVKRPYFGTLLYVTHVQTPVHDVLVGAGLFDGNLDHGAWTLLECQTIDGALTSFETERSLVDARFPFPWDMPAERAFDLDEGEILVGADGKQWVVSGGNGGSRSHFWTRDFGGAGADGGADADDGAAGGAGAGAAAAAAEGGASTRRESRRERIRRRVHSIGYGVDDDDDDVVVDAAEDIALLKCM